MSKSHWVAETDTLAGEIYHSLTKGKEREAETHFEAMNRLTEEWCCSELKTSGINLDEYEDCLPQVWRKLWLTIERRAAEGEPVKSVLATLKPIVRSVSVDHLRQTKRPYRRLINHLAVLYEQGKLITKWTQGKTELIGRPEWRAHPLSAETPFGAWHRERIRLELDEQFSVSPPKHLGEQLVVLMGITFRIYPFPLRGRELEAICLDFLNLKMPETISIQTTVTGENDSGTTLGDFLVSPEPSPGEMVVKEAAFHSLLEQSKSILSQMSARTQEAMLLALETDTLDCYCQPESPVNVLTPLHQDAFEMLPQEARLLATQDAEMVPIPDEEIASRMKITKGNLQILRFRARKRLQEAGIVE